MELQILHRPVAGKMINQAILSIPFKRKAGATRKFFSIIDLMNLPNP